MLKEQPSEAEETQKPKGWRLRHGLAYVIGGQINSKVSNSVVEFNPKTGRWRRVASSLLARSAHSAAGFGSAIVSCGGWDGRTVVGFAELFLPAKNRWFRLPGLLDARSAHCAVAQEEDGRVFVTGGENEFGNELDLVEYCTLPVGNSAGSPESHSFLTWRRAAPMNQKRQYHALAYAKGKIVAVGGVINRREVTRTVEVFSPPDRGNPLGQWTFVKRLDLAYNYPFAIAVDGYFFVFHPDDEIWTDVGALSTVREVNGVIAFPSASRFQTL
ncbi:unnamed protein product [Dibothriocephalus latus]|uniref:Uncharacterized protein n=1 Tax=Dibothriocephalus latus TaxID=60516 RepID=A0A3P6UA52_DIBLA|nr:unnamed protein product [Dibothriocephalus latus]